MSTIEKRDEAIDLARYKQAAGEVETGNRDDALWYKAFADGGGDENATKAAYIRLRVEQLRRRAADAASAVRVGAKSLYDVLCIPRDASDEQIHAGYQQQKWQLETQENKGAETTKKLLIIEHAKRVLLDPARRAAYDARITAEAAQPEKAQQGKSSGSIPTSASEPLSNRELYAAYLGEKNQDYYLNKFEEFDRLGDGMHISWNWWACIGGPTWLLYRKLYAWSFAAVLFHTILNMVLDLSTNLSSNSIILILFLWGIIFFGVATFGNALYYRRVKSKIAAAQIIARNDNQLVEILRKKGGVHTWVVWVVSAFWIIAVIGIIAAIAIPAYSDYTKKAKAQVSGNVPQATHELPNPSGQGVSYDQNDPPFKEANSLSAAGKYAEAVEIWRPLAERGNARAQYAMGASYLAGRGVPKDYAEAGKWLRLSAEQGDARAQVAIGVNYSKGQGVTQSYQEAVKWYRSAAEQGNVRGQVLLGIAYAQGEGVIQDQQEAAKWIRLAAKQGDANMQEILGNFYRSGEGAPLDYIKAHMWYSIAAASGNKEIVASATESRDSLERVMSPNDIIRSRQMARECMNSNYENCD